jgi:hypothetical protein
MTCPCGSDRIAPSNLAGGYFRCARCIYQRTLAAAKRYRRSAKARVCRQRYDRSVKGRARRDRANAKRIEVGDRTIYAKTLEQRDAMRALVKQRMADFHQRQHESQQG